MSALREQIADYLLVRRSFGFALTTDEYLLRQFAGFVERRGNAEISTDIVSEWAASSDGSTEWHRERLAKLRRFLLWAHSFDPELPIPAPPASCNGHRQPVPYLYSAEEIRRLMDYTSVFLSSAKASMFRTLIGLVSCTGLRIGEALRADLTDLDGTVLTIHNSKNGASRLVPLHATTGEALNLYLRTVRPQLTKTPHCPAIFLSRSGTRLLYTNVHADFRRVAQSAGIPKTPAGHYPHLHDLRHSFAVATMIDAYLNGSDAARVVPVLSAYLGHRRPADTYWYLHASSELLAAAAARMEMDGDCND